MSTKIEIIPYKPEHAYAVLEKNVREIDLQLSKCWDWETGAKQWEKTGPAFTLLADGEVVACAGVIMMDWNRGEAWALVSSLAYKYPVALFRGMKIGLDNIIREKNLRRVQAVCLNGHKEGERTLKHLGFEYEGIMRAWGPDGKDYCLFGRIC